MDEISIAHDAAETARRIGQLLRDLEQRTGRAVQSAELERLDVSTMHNPTAQYVRTFYIQMTPPPGSIR